MSTQHTWLVHSENGETKRVPVDTVGGKVDADGVFWAVIAGSDTRPASDVINCR